MIKFVRKTGIITKGIVYSLIGVLTFLAAINFGGKISGKNEVITFLQEQLFGAILLIILSLGLYAYSFWKFYSAFLDGKKEGTDKAGILKRIGYFFSGLIYGFFSTSIILKVFSLSSNSNTKQSVTQNLMSSNGGVIILYIVAVILAAVGIYQIYKGYTKSFLDDIKISSKIESKKMLEKVGYFGFIARGISFLIFAFFVFTALNNNQTHAVRGLEGVFNFLQTFTWGNILMGIMSLGFLCYGIYQYFLARYSSIY
ncbi:DUF1206 domain-containing protein [Polaribacter pectinis]|uniref:DUF1206 domain-containing protein n=1 Tax=Polaribacter pectinis TaxID=2738844 RepID=A0A7G9LEA9_9FLAO|nr:DUF1206 domain-containing protein [Polaribacter pectinis]QNM86958.1 DUF1206 domain-containing protein [Polaribacter pectinis]